MQMAQCLIHGDGTERAASDTQNDEVVKIFPDVFCGCQNIFDDFLLVVRKFRPAHPAFSAVFGNEVERGFCGRVHFGKILFGEAVFADIRRHHIVVIKFKFVFNLVVLH